VLSVRPHQLVMSRTISLWQRWLLMLGPSSTPLHSACSCLRTRGFAESTYANSRAPVVPVNSKLWLTIFTDAVAPEGMSVPCGHKSSGHAPFGCPRCRTAAGMGRLVAAWIDHHGFGGQ
jgi:hypothetical protein